MVPRWRAVNFIPDVGFDDLHDRPRISPRISLVAFSRRGTGREQPLARARARARGSIKSEPKRCLREETRRIGRRRSEEGAGG